LASTKKSFSEKLPTKGNLEDFMNTFMMKEELLEILKRRIKR